MKGQVLDALTLMKGLQQKSFPLAAEGPQVDMYDTDAAASKLEMDDSGETSLLLMT